MSNPRKSALALAATLLATSAGSALATTGHFEWVGAVDNDWNRAANWSCVSGSGTYPGAGTDDVAIILDQAGMSRPQPVLDDANYTIDRLEIRDPSSARTMLTINGRTLTVSGVDDLQIQGSDATLLVNGVNGTLALSSNTSSGHQIAGIVELGSSSAVLDIAANVAFVPYSSIDGMILGSDASAQVTIANTKVFTNNIPVQGTLKFAGTGEFENRDVVQATAGVIEMGPSVIVDDGPTTDTLRWYAIGAGSKVSFLRAHTGASNLVGRFEVATPGGGSSGLFRFEANVTTLGKFNDNGTVRSTCPSAANCRFEFANSAQFIFKNLGLGNSTCSSCP